MTYRERQKEKVKWGDCGKDMAAGSLASHRMTQHGKAKADKWSWNESTTVGVKTQTYQIEFPTKGGTRECPVEG